MLGHFGWKWTQLPPMLPPPVLSQEEQIVSAVEALRQEAERERLEAIQAALAGSPSDSGAEVVVRQAEARAGIC